MGILKLGYLEIRVKDIAKAAHYYTQVLGLKDTLDRQVHRVEVARADVALKHRDMWRVQGVQRVTGGKILTQPRVGCFCLAHHRCIRFEEYVDGGEFQRPAGV